MAVLVPQMAFPATAERGIPDARLGSNPLSLLASTLIVSRATPNTVELVTTGECCCPNIQDSVRPSHSEARTVVRNRPRPPRRALGCTDGHSSTFPWSAVQRHRAPTLRRSGSQIRRLTPPVPHKWRRRQPRCLKSSSLLLSEACLRSRRVDALSPIACAAGVRFDQYRKDREP